jgi:excinuclease ABC subunit C
VQGVKDATVEQIATVPGFGDTSARKVLQALGVEVTVPDSDTTPDVSAPTDPLLDVTDGPSGPPPSA